MSTSNMSGGSCAVTRSTSWPASLGVRATTLKAHPNVQFHFTPTSASWLNQVEVWFSILQGQSLSGASFTTLKQLEQHIDAYIKAYNVRAEPFVWTI